MQAAKVNEGWESNANAQRHPYIVLSYDRSIPTRAKDCVRACGLSHCSGACACRRRPSALRRGPCMRSQSTQR